MKIQIKDKYRLANVSPRNVTFHQFHHCFSAAIINSNDIDVTIRIDSVLDPRDHDIYGTEFTISVKEFNLMQGSLIKI